LVPIPKDNEKLDISIHIEPKSSPTMIRAESIESTVTTDPFADSIETDSEDAYEDILEFEDTGQTPKVDPLRNTLSFQHFTKTTNNVSGSPIQTRNSSPELQISSIESSPSQNDLRVKPINEIPVGIKNTMHQMTVPIANLIPISASENGLPAPPSLKPIQPTVITEAELNQFLELAEKTANSLILMSKTPNNIVRDTLVKVNKITSKALDTNDWSRELLEAYSEKLIEVLKNKIIID
jgi:hypothetical protein